MAIKLISKKDKWDKFLANNPNALLYHKWDFLKVVEKHTGYELLPYGVYKGEQLIAIFPLFYKRMALLKFLFSPPPGSGVPYLGPVLDKEYDFLKQDKKESFINQVAEEIDTVVKKIGPNYFAVTLVPNFKDI